MGTELRSDLVVVAGAGAGLGAAIARRFGREGAQVVLLARTVSRLEDVTGGLRRQGVDAHALPVDLADPESVRRGFVTLGDRFGHPGVLVYNASRYIAGMPTSVDVGDLVHGFMVGAAGALVAVQQAAPAMRAARSGTVLLTGSGVGVRPFVGSAALGVQKAALRNLASTLADELEPDGVHVAMVTIDGVIGKGEKFAPDALAEAYWHLHTQPRTAWDREIVIRGTST